MRTNGEVLLISCYELGHQPFHLASLSAQLHKAGYQPICVDTAIDDLTTETLLAAHFIAIAVPMLTALRLGEQVAQRVRNVNPTAHICLYGLYALLNADHLLQNAADSVVGGEYEIPILRLLQSLEENNSDAIPGIITRTASSGAWLQRIPFVLPDRQQLPELARYAQLKTGNDLRLVGYTETTRGCKHTCLHCPVTPVYKGRFFAVPAEIVLQDIKTQVARGAEHITFGDPDFWNGPTHALRIVQALHQEFPHVSFDATIKIEHILRHRHLLPAMKEAGCVFIVAAVESLNDGVLSHLNKGHTAADVAEAFDLTEQTGITLRPSLLPFTPWETLDSYIKLLTFFETRHMIEHVDPVHLSIRLLVPPGSALLQTSAEEAIWSGELDSAAYGYRWQHPDHRMDELQAEVAALVELAEQAQADPILTFFHIKERALKLAGQKYSIFRDYRQYGPGKTLPHLTESWFCCAEPTCTQMSKHLTLRPDT